MDGRRADSGSNGPDERDAGSLPVETLERVRRFSHDIVSPLMSVLALSEVLMLEAKGDDRLNEDLRRIHAAAEEALSLVRALGSEVGTRRTGL